MPKTTTPSHIIFKLQKAKDKQKILKQDSRKRRENKIQRKNPYLRITVDLLETMLARE